MKKTFIRFTNYDEQRRYYYYMCHIISVYILFEFSLFYIIYKKIQF